jgi:hypothetical protein
MTANYNAVLSGSYSDNQTTYTLTTGSATTNSTGSTMYVVVVIKTALTGLVPSVTDSKGNSYSQIGSTITDGQGTYLYRFQSVNMVGGSGHTVTVSNPSFATGTVGSFTSTTITDGTKSFTTNQWASYSCANLTRNDSANVVSNTATVLTFSSVPTSTANGDSYVLGALKMSVVAVELTGCATVSPLDQSTVNSGDYALPKGPGSQTLGAEAANGAVLITAFELLDAANITYTIPTGFTSLYTSGNAGGYPNNINLAVAIQVVSGAGTYNPTWTITGGSGGSFLTTAMDSFIGGSPVDYAINNVATGTIPGDATGDVLRAAFTKLNTSVESLASALALRSTNTGVFGVSSTTGTTTVLNDSTQTWATNQFAGQYLILGGQTVTNPLLAGYSQKIASNTATAITTTAAFGAAIPALIPYQIVPTVSNPTEGSATNVGGTAPSTLVDGFKAWTTNQWQGLYQVTLLGGTYAGQSSIIASNTANTLTLTTAFSTAIAAGTPYMIGSVALQSIQYVTAGTTVTVGVGTQVLELNGPTSMTVTLPSAPYDTQILEISTTTAITSFAMTGGTVSGSPSSLSANTGISFRYRAANTTWYRRY